MKNIDPGAPNLWIVLFSGAPKNFIKHDYSILEIQLKLKLSIRGTLKVCLVR
jgi:hypothetical protein